MESRSRLEWLPSPTGSHQSPLQGSVLANHRAFHTALLHAYTLQNTHFPGPSASRWTLQCPPTGTKYVPNLEFSNFSEVMKKVALITGVTGQDGSYLAEFLLEKGYEVHGIKRRSSSFNTERIDHIYQPPNKQDAKFRLHYGDLTDSSNLTRIINEVQPDEIYNLGAQSHVAVSFESPEYTADVDAIGTLRLLEAIRFLGLEKKTRFYQASTSELFGQVQEIPQKETTPFYLARPMLLRSCMRTG